MAINPAEVQWDDAPARQPNQTFHNPQTMPASLDIAGLYGNFQQQFPSARITSTVRTPAENARLPNAAPNSFHMTGEAWDAVPSTPEEEQALVAWGTQNGLQVEVERAPYHVHFEPPARGLATTTLGGSGGAGSGGIDPAAIQWDDALAEDGQGLELDIVGDWDEAGNPRANDSQIGEAPPPANPSLFRMDSDFMERSKGVAPGEMLWAAAKDMFGGHGSAAEFLAREVGGKVDRGTDGEPVVVLPDGTRYRVNDAGFDATDAANIAGNVAAAYLPASWAANLSRARQVGVGGRMLLQGAAAAGTDAAEQAAVNEGRIDGSRVALAGVGGAGGELAGTVLAAGGRRALSALSRTGATERAREMLSSAGISRTPEKVADLAKRVPELDAGADPRALLGQSEYGLQYTRAQRAMEPAVKFREASREELLRQSSGGAPVLREAENANAERVSSALETIGERLGGKPGTTPAELAQGAASRLREQADELGGRIGQAYDEASKGSRTAISSEAVGSLPQRLRGAVQDFQPNRDLTPATAKTLEQIELATRDILAKGNVKGVTLKALETQRRILNNNYAAASNNADRAAMGALKREFDGWLDESIDTALASGDPASLQALKEARALRAEFGRRFEGKADTDKFIAGLLDGTRTPEELVNIALGAGQVSKAGGARFVQRLKDAAGNDPEVIGQLRAAHFMRLTHDAAGKPLDFGKLIGNIRRTEHSNGSVVKALYSPQEWAEIRRLASALEPLVAKGDFARTSGSAERMARMLFQKMGSSLPLGFNLPFDKGAEFVQWMRANKALNAPLKLRRPADPMAPAAVSAIKTDRNAEPAN